MDYYINPANLTSAFTVPTAVVDSHIKFAKAEHIKVLLYIFRNMSAAFSPEEISEKTGVDVYNAKEALIYWADNGILLPLRQEKPAERPKAEPQTRVTVRAQKPSRTDVARRGSEDKKIEYLLREAQIKLGRILKDNEASTFVWLYDDLGLDVSVIMLIIQYAVQHGRANLRFIESTAVRFINDGIDDISAADDELRKMAVSEQAWQVVSSCFGFEKRKPGKREGELSLLWLEEWKIPKELLVAAYDECVDRNSRFSLPYVAKIIESWHEKGYKTTADIESERRERTENKESYASYDLDLYEKLMNSKEQ